MPEHGLYTQFEGYRVPREAELHAALRDGLVAIDTNVLLSLYRYNPATVSDLLGLLAKLGDRLFVPHQVLREFWRNRRLVLGNPAGARAEAHRLLLKNRDGSTAAIERWAKQVALPQETTQELAALIEDAYIEVNARLEAVGSVRVSAATPTDEDSVLNRLEPILHGKVGAAFIEDRSEAEILEGNRRVVEQIPPGFKDADKLESDNPERAAGDYLIWVQLLEEAKTRDLDLVLVTGDVKEDWWERGAQGALIGPRRELIEEFREVAGGRVHLLEPAAFLQASEVLDVEIDPQSVQDVERVRDEVAVWTADAVGAVLRALRVEELAQADVIEAAAANGGSLDRDRVYEVANLPDEKMLIGFTRPVVRITRMLQEEGVVPAGVPQLLYPWYESGGRATHLRVPEDIVEMNL